MLGGRRAHLIWVAALFAYVFAVTQRTSLGAAGLDAADRLGVSPGTLSLLMLLQVGVYAAGQIPAGLLVDRIGPRRIFIVSGLMLGSGQVLLAVAESVVVAGIARVLVGSGDALAFASMRHRLRAGSRPGGCRC